MFNLYFAGMTEEDTNSFMKKNRVARLLSYTGRRSEIEFFNAGERGPLFIDSGAFSVAHSDRSVDIDSYIDYINSHPEVNVWAQLDSIPFPILNSHTAKKSCEKSWESYLYIMERVTVDPDKILPIYHFGEPFSGLERILNTEVRGKLPDYIGVGGRHGVSTKEQENYFETVFRIVKNSKNPKVKIHAFGMTVLDLLEKYPFYSADSTSWLVLANHGSIIGKRGKWYVSDRAKNAPNHILNQPELAKKQFFKEIEEFGFTYEQLSTDYKSRWKYNILFMKRWADNYVYRPHFVKTRKLF